MLDLICFLYTVLDSGLIVSEKNGEICWVVIYNTYIINETQEHYASI